MKFSAIVSDSKSLETLVEAMTCAAKFSDSPKFNILLTPEGMSFICATAVRCGYFVEIKLSKQEIFTQYAFQGYSDDLNVIIFDVSKEHFIPLFQQHSEVIKFKLVKRHEAPHLSVELRSVDVVSLLPIEFLFNYSEDYIAPVLKEPCIHLTLYPLPLLLKTINALQQLNIDSFKMSTTPNGRVKYFATSDNSDYKLVLTDLMVMDDSDYEKDIDDMKFELKMLQTFLSSLSPHIDKLYMKITPTGLLQYSVKIGYMGVVLLARCLRNIDE